MAWKPPARSELRERVRFEVRRKGERVGGVIKEEWVTFCPDRRVRLLPQRGGESVIADRAAGVSVWILDVPADSVVRQITAAMRVVDARNEARTWDIKSPPLDLAGDDRWRTLTLEMGGSDG